MSFILSNNNFNVPQLNHKELGQEFCALYYNSFSSHGINGVVNLYHPSAQITFLDEECIGVIAYNQKLINIGISKIVFNNLIGTTQSHGADTIIISITGECCPYIGLHCDNNWNKFSDVFILNQINGNWIISHHIFKVFA